MIRYISHDTIEEMATEFDPGAVVRIASEVTTRTAHATGVSARNYRVNAQMVDERGDVHYVRIFTGQVQQFIGHTTKSEHEALARATKDTDAVQAAITLWFRSAAYEVRGGQVTMPTNLALIDAKGAEFLQHDSNGHPHIDEPALHRAIGAAAVVQ